MNKRNYRIIISTFTAVCMAAGVLLAGCSSENAVSPGVSASSVQAQTQQQTQLQSQLQQTESQPQSQAESQTAPQTGSQTEPAGGLQKETQENQQANPVAQSEQETAAGASDVSREESTGENGKRFVNDYNASDKSYTASDNFISPKENREYGQTLTVDYYSTTLGTVRQADVILPYGYDTARSYPVLYLLHGMGGNNKSWSDMGVKYIVQNVHYENGVKDMIVVCPNCHVSSDVVDNGSNYRSILPGYERFEQELLNDLMPYINSNYSAATGRNNTAIAGYSLGGRCALSIGFKHQDMFGYIGTFSTAGGVIPSGNSKNASSAQLPNGFEINPEYGDFNLLFMNVGESDGVCGHTSYEYDEELTKRGIKHIFYEMEGDHEGSVWQNGLYNFVKRIF